MCLAWSCHKLGQNAQLYCWYSTISTEVWWWPTDRPTAPAHALSKQVHQVCLLFRIKASTYITSTTFLNYSLMTLLFMPSLPLKQKLLFETASLMWTASVWLTTLLLTPFFPHTKTQERNFRRFVHQFSSQSFTRISNLPFTIQIFGPSVRPPLPRAFLRISAQQQQQPLCRLTITLLHSADIPSCTMAI